MAKRKSLMWLSLRMYVRTLVYVCACTYTVDLPLLHHWGGKFETKSTIATTELTQTWLLSLGKFTFLIRKILTL